MGEHVVDIGPRVPRTAHPALRWCATRLLDLLGWRLDIHLPDEPKFIILGAPHTSNWDGVIGVLAMLAMELRLALYVKHTAFRSPVVGDVLRGLHDDPCIHAELLRHRVVDAPGMRGRGTGAAGEHRIAAVEQRLHAGVAELLEQLAQVGHGDALRLAYVDAAQQRDRLSGAALQFAGCHSWIGLPSGSFRRANVPFG